MMTNQRQVIGWIIAAAVWIAWGLAIVGCAETKLADKRPDRPFPDRPDITWSEYCELKEFECDVVEVAASCRSVLAYCRVD